jgi:hypothetical protein
MTDIAIERRMRLPPSWGLIERVRATVSEALARASADVRDAAVMVASELAENAIKYGEALADDECGYVTLSVGPQLISIRSLNGVSSMERVRDVVQRIDTIAKAESAEALYVARLREMLETPSDSASHLGLLRIAYEGGFRLSCAYEAPVLTIIAEREWT